MLKLKTIIDQLKNSDYELLENQLIQSKADNFLFLLRSYKENSLTDEKIIEHLKTNSNSFYTLKSRLYDKIQSGLIENSSGEKSEILKQLASIPEYCYNTPRETAEAILHKLESDLKAFDMSGDLISVYSALKKINLYTPQYYHYSQLYNKHLAYTAALEKAEELLANFTKTLSLYYLSKSPELIEILNLIKKEIKNIYLLNKSQNIEVIHNVIIIQLQLFTNTSNEDEEATEDLINAVENITKKFASNSYQHYALISSFLKYEYYNKINQSKKAQNYFDEVNGSISKWLLLDNSCLATAFLFSKINNYCKANKEKELDIENEKTPLLYDQNNLYCEINIKLYYAISKLIAGKHKESAKILNELLNNVSLKDILHAEIEIKLALAYIYVIQSEFDLASNVLRSIVRKIKSQDVYDYENAIAFSKILELSMNSDKSEASKDKITKAVRLFEFENTGERKILQFLNNEIEKLKLSKKL